VNYAIFWNDVVTIVIAKRPIFTKVHSNFKTSYMFIAIVVIIAVAITSILVGRLYQKRNTRTGTFSLALYNENIGDYEEALTKYEAALAEIKKTKRNQTFRSIILDKIKVLHTVVQYEKNVFSLNKTIY
jgi:hypothetical protein